MYREVKILKHHGVQYIKNLRNQPLSPLFRGRPEIAGDMTKEEISFLSNLCPSGAISGETGSLDLGKCMFCGECQFALPSKVSFTNDYRIAANRRTDLIISPGEKKLIRLDEKNIRPDIRKLFSKGLKLRQVSAGGDNSCEMELNASANVNFDLGRFGIEFVASPRHADGVVITGPVTANMSEALRLTIEAIPEPKMVILAGTDAISGGMFEESPAIDRSSIENLRVDLYVPGNPVHPLSFINGLLDLIYIKH